MLSHLELLADGSVDAIVVEVLRLGYWRVNKVDWLVNGKKQTFGHSDYIIVATEQGSWYAYGCCRLCLTAMLLLAETCESRTGQQSSMQSDVVSCATRTPL